MELGQLFGWDAYFYSIFAQAADTEEFRVIAMRALHELGFDFFAYGMCSVTPFMRPRTSIYRAVAEAECNTVIDLKLEHDAA